MYFRIFLSSDLKETRPCTEGTFGMLSPILLQDVLEVPPPWVVGTRNGLRGPLFELLVELNDQRREGPFLKVAVQPRGDKQLPRLRLLRIIHNGRTTPSVAPFCVETHCAVEAVGWDSPLEILRDNVLIGQHGRLEVWVVVFDGLNELDEAEEGFFVGLEDHDTGTDLPRIRHGEGGEGLGAEQRGNAHGPDDDGRRVKEDYPIVTPFTIHFWVEEVKFGMDMRLKINWLDNPSKLSKKGNSFCGSVLVNKDKFWDRRRSHAELVNAFP